MTTTTATMTPSSLLLRYFEIAQGRLQRFTDCSNECSRRESMPSGPDLSWHRNQIVESQLASLDDAMAEWQQQQGQNDNDSSGKVDSTISREAVQGVLRQIGTGDFSCVLFEDDGDKEDFASPLSTPLSSTTGLRSRSSRGSGNGNSQQRVSDGVREVTRNDDEVLQEKQSLLTDAVEKTNELARRAYSHSVLVSEWQLGLQQSGNLPQCGMRELRDNGNIDDESILEYCGLMMAAVRLPDVQQYLQTGTAAFIISLGDNSDGSLESVDLDHEKSVEGRLLHIQQLYWRALGWQSSYASDQLRCLLSGDNTINNPKVLETLTKYASAMTVAVTNAAMSNIGESNDQLNDDGTTRVVSVSYSEKIISVPNNAADDSNITSHSLSAPTSNTIDEHEVSQQRRELDTARATSMLQQQLWDEFLALPSDEQQKTVEKATLAHQEFMEKVANTPPGSDRILLMQSIDGEVQKLLVIYKLWCSETNSASG